MNGKAIRVLALEGTPEMIGVAHGAACAAEIQAYGADRLRRCSEESALDRDALLALAQACLPAHRAYAPDLYEEMCALAGAVGVSPAEAMVTGGYTDFIDTVRAHARQAPLEHNCTAAVVPDGRAGGRGFLAQTWDMHASATPHVILTHLRPLGQPAATVFTTTGCLGQIGMNDAGLAIGINNLSADNGRIGVTWPFVVRKALQQRDAAAALEVILDAELAGGHNFLVLDRAGAGFSVEAMPGVHHVQRLDEAPLVHTNHCLDDATHAVESAAPEALVASSRQRLEHARALLAEGEVGLAELVSLTRDERAICRHVGAAGDFETCGAVVMRPRAAELWACWGVPSENVFESFRVGSDEC